MRLRSFTGAWALERAIEDVRAGRTGTPLGEARFTPAPDGLAYAEEGTLAFAGSPPMHATRRYLWRDGGAGTIDVLFADGRFFHSFDADDAAPAATHDCAPDSYRVRYDFSAWPRWQAEWRVTGPRKDYTMVSRFRPHHEPPPPPRPPRRRLRPGPRARHPPPRALPRHAAPASRTQPPRTAFSRQPCMAR